MTDVVVDSNVVVGARMQRDQWHDAGRAIVSGIDAGDLPRGRLTYFCLPEVLTPIEKRAGDGPARETLAFLIESRGFDLVYVAREDVTKGLAIYRREDGIEVVDCFTVAYMQRLGIEFVYSFDDDFDRFDGITRIVSADDPFA
jgi:predicted nucleic acid-binding protein